MADLNVTLTPAEVERIISDTQDTLRFCVYGTPLIGERDETAEACVSILEKLGHPPRIQVLAQMEANKRGDA